MSRHVGKIITETGYQAMPVYQGVCRCGAKGPYVPSHAQADKWVDDHLVAAVRAQVHRTTRNPTMEDQVNWYRQMEKSAGDPETARQWGQLAHELEHRLGRDEHSTQPDLFAPSVTDESE